MIIYLDLSLLWLKTRILSADDFKKHATSKGQHLDTAMWYWSADTLFWQLSIDQIMDVQYQVAGCHTS